MRKFTHIKPEELTDNPFSLIGHDWMLVTATDREGNANSMTASWGGMGVLWNRNVCFLFIRPQRYTHEFAECGDFVTLCFFDECYRKVLAGCGRESGRDVNKAEKYELTPARDQNGAVYYEEARMVISAKKLYRGELRKECFTDPGPLAEYPMGDYHSVFVAEITEVQKRD